MSHEESVGSQTVGGQAAAGIETEPAQPQERSSHENERYVMRNNGMSDPVIFPFSQHDRHNQGRDTGIDMNHRSAGEIDRTHPLQEAASPHPVRHREIGQNDPQHDKHRVARKLDPLGERPQNKSGSNQSEHALEHDERQFGNATGHHRIDRDTVQKGFVETADNGSQRIARLHESGAERPAIPESYPQNTDHSDDEHRLHDDAQYVFLAHQPAVEQRDSGNAHQQHENGGHDQPCRVARIQHGSFPGQREFRCIGRTRDILRAQARGKQAGRNDGSHHADLRKSRYNIACHDFSFKLHVIIEIIFPFPHCKGLCRPSLRYGYGPRPRSV